MINDNKAIKEAITNANNIVILTHAGPDGDAIGSSLGLWHYLQVQGKEAQVIIQDPFAKNMKHLEGQEKVMFYLDQSIQIKALLKNCDVLFALDFNAWHRAGDLGAYIAENRPPKVVMIDHHPGPDDFYDLGYHDDQCGSTAELVYRMVAEWNEAIPLGGLEAIYTGIMTDTGSFRFPATSAATHRILAEMKDQGLIHAPLHEAVYANNSLNRLQLQGMAISQRLEILEEGQVALIYLTLEDLKEYQAEKGDTEGIVNMALSIEGVHVAIFVKEDVEKIKISFRSQGEFAVNALSQKYFNGGGHYNAAGGRLDKMPMTEALNFIKEKVHEALH